MRDWETKAQKKLLEDKLSALSIARGDAQLLATQYEWQHKFLEVEEEES